MVEQLLEQNTPPNIYLKTEVNIGRLTHSYTFVKASNYLPTVVTRLYLFTNSSSGRFIKNVIYATDCGDCGSVIYGSFNGVGYVRRGG